MSSPSELPTSPVAQEVTSFNKEALKPTETKEKSQLPSNEDVAQEKTHQNILAGVAAQPKLQRVGPPQEKSVLPGAEDINPDKFKKVLGEVSGADAQLHHVQTREKNVLPNTDDVAQEKTRQNLLAGVEAQPKLHHVDAPQEKVVLPGAEEVNPNKFKDLLGEVSGTDAQLRHVETQEKNVLPDTSDIAAEKTEAQRRSAIESFNKENLKHTETVVKDVKPDKEINPNKFKSVLGEVSGGEAQLRHVETEEKNVLPATSDITAEKTESQRRSAIESFNKENLKHAETVVKDVKPDKETIEQERKSGSES